MKNILVTGISRGLGKEVASLLLSQGDRVYGTYNNNEVAANELKNKYDALEVYRVDLSRSSDIDGLIDKLKDVKLDGIVNCAGAFLDIDFDKFNRESFEKTFRINAFAPVYIVNGLQRNLNDHASIVNVASNDAMVGSIIGIAYSASKSALLNLTQSLANILAKRKIRVNAVAPGWMGDGMQAPEEILEAAAEYNLLKKVGGYGEVAEVVIFLLSDKASYVNGTTVTVDGGDMATSYILQKEAEV